ncbi:transporter substrate-binding domain-containing protein [Oceanimonas pelagia]|uniref:Transporter substrate-binding domain-containing protein n=1 Tax=Oceanimonas pelagia TaxID=3028314 RepID=A0AA50Q8V9_9GAMM|nr:transporter substrate-binding domain-containing protein [Oceanimonas pelagia]WMC12430.1 transporter substrate-binding domain-containing protein [Oceanimonas pelagia]
MLRLLLLWLLPALALAEPRVLTACGHPVYPPLSWAQNGELTGIAPHLARKLLAEQGYQLDMRVFGNWERCQLAARRGKVDLIVAAYKTQARETDFLFSSTPIVADPVVLFTHFGNGSRVPWNLTDKTLGLLFGDSFGDEFDKLAATHPHVERVSTGEQNFHKLALGRIDYMPVGLATGRLQAQKLGLTERVLPLPELLTLEYYHLAVPRHSPLAPLLPALSNRLSQLAETGYIEQITPYFERHYLDAP